MAPIDLEYMNIVTDLQHVLQHVRASHEWVVVVCPNSETAAHCTRIIAASVPKDAAFSGRTARFLNDGTLSVAPATEKVFVPDGTPFTVAYIGWRAKDDPTGMTAWQTKAARLLRVER